MSEAVINEQATPTLSVSELQVGGAEGALAARLYKAAVDGKRDILIVFFHGGGFVDGDLDDPDNFLRHLASASGYPVVLSSTYTLAPVKPFPAAVEDAHAALVISGAVGGDGDRARGPVQQLGRERGLERLHQRRDGCLGQLQRIGRAREAAGVDHLHENFHCLQFVHSDCSAI